MIKKFFSQPTLFISILLSILMVVNEADFIYSVFCFIIISWKYCSEKKWIAKIPRFLTATLSIISFILIMMKYRTLFSQEAALSLLITLTSLKIMDYEEERDHKFVCLLAFILLILKSIFSIEIYWIIPTSMSFFMVWVALIDNQIKTKYRFMTKLFLRSLPMTTFFFLFFPRFVVPWAMQRQETKNSVGFSNQLNPGDVSQIAQSTAVAFRVKFNAGLEPAINQLYWVGSVLNISKGLTWLENFRPKEGNLVSDKYKRSAAFENRSELISYQVLLEPNSEEFIFGLDRIINVELPDQRAISLEENIFRKSNNKKSVEYTGYSKLTKSVTLEKSLIQEEPLLTLSEKTDGRGKTIKNKIKLLEEAEAEDIYLQVNDLPEKSKDFVEQILSKKLSAVENYYLLKDFFKVGGFKYTLNPGTYKGKLSLDEFLFKRKIGFCEHFAGAFATLARALKIPARVIIGYQGGEFNTVGDYWIVRQNDAHAWVSLFLNNHWVRVDPTVWIAPLRVEIGAQEFFKLSETEREDYQKFKLNYQAKDTQFLDQFVYFFDSMNYKYTSFLLDFDQVGQQNFIKENKNFLIEVLIIFISIIILTSVIRRKKEKEQKFSQQQMGKMISALSKLGLQRLKNQAPLEFLNLAKAQRPELKTEIDELSNLYQNEMYKENHQDEKSKII